jgi:hypothetical protein
VALKARCCALLALRSRSGVQVAGSALTISDARCSSATPRCRSRAARIALPAKKATTISARAGRPPRRRFTPASLWSTKLL